MGYPMTFQRVIRRNRLTGNYLDAAPWVQGGERDPVHDFQCRVAGDLRRLERNSRDPRHLDAYSRETGVSPDQVRLVLDAFFTSTFPSLDFKQWPPGEWGDCDMEIEVAPDAEDAA